MAAPVRKQFQLHFWKKYFQLFILFLFSTNSNSQPKLVLPVGHTAMVSSAQFSPDGKHVVTASWDNTAKIWQVSDGRLINELKGHLEPIISAVYSPTGKYILTASKDKTARLWDPSKGTFSIQLKGHTDWISNAFFSNDGKQIVTTSWDSTARTWDAVTGKLISEFKGHMAAVNSAAISPDKKFLITASKDNSVIIWQTVTKRILHKITHHSDWVNTIKISPDGKSFVTASKDGSAKVYDLVTGKIIFDLNVSNESVTTASYSSDGKYILTTSADHTAKMWSAVNGKLLAALKGHSGSVSSASFSPDNKFIVTGSLDHTSKIWEVPTGKLLHTLEAHSDAINTVAFSPDGKHIATASLDLTGKLWNVKDGSLRSDLKSHLSVVKQATYSPDGKFIVTVSWDHTTKIWGAADGHLISELAGRTNWGNFINTASFSPDGEQIVTSSADGTAKIWRTSEGMILKELQGHKELVNTAKYSPSGKLIVTTSWDQTSKIWDASRGEILFNLEGHRNVVNTASFSPDEKHLVTTSWDSTARLWNTHTGELLKILTGHKAKLTMATFSENGKLLVTSSWDGTARLWTSKGDFLFQLKGHAAQVNTAIFSPDSKLLVTASQDNTARIWDTSNGEVLYELKGHTEDIYNALFTPDGKYIVTASGDNTAKIWIATSGKLHADLTGHTASLNSIAISPDSKQLITSAEDNTIKRWAIEKGELLYTFFPVDNIDYLAIDKDGHYDGTEIARKMLYYVCDTEIIDLEQFKNLSWEPSLVSKILGANKEIITAKKITDINICNYTPVIKEKAYRNGKYNFEVEARKGGVEEIHVYANNKLVLNINPATLERKGNTYFVSVQEKSVLPYFLPGEQNQVLIKATTRGGVMMSRGAPTKSMTDIKSSGPPNMYIISIGISEYKGEQIKLKYASKDAVKFTSTITASGQKLLNNDGRQHVFFYNFNTDSGSKLWPLKKTIQETFRTISQKAKASDIVILFFAGHGVLQQGHKNLYLLTAEASSLEISGVEKEVSISTDELKEWFQKIKANKQLLILDACNSGQAITNLKELVTGRSIPADQQRALENLKDRTGTYILSASAAGQLAYESSIYGQGLLTYSLLTGIKLGGGLKDNKFIDVTRWFNFTTENVKMLASDNNKSQHTQILGNASFDIGLVDKEIIEKIDLSVTKKIFRNSKFIQSTILFNDDLDIEGSLNYELNELSKKADSSAIVFVGDNPFVEAYSIRGTYDVENSKVTVKISLVKGTTLIDNFSISGTVEKKSALVRNIIFEVQKRIDK